MHDLLSNLRCHVGSVTSDTLIGGCVSGDGVVVTCQSASDSASCVGLQTCSVVMLAVGRRKTVEEFLDGSQETMSGIFPDSTSRWRMGSACTSVGTVGFRDSDLLGVALCVSPISYNGLKIAILGPLPCMWLHIKFANKYFSLFLVSF